MIIGANALTAPNSLKSDAKTANKQALPFVPLALVGGSTFYITLLLQLCHSYLLYYNVALQDYNSLEKPNKSQITHVDLDLEILDILKVIEE